MTSYAVTAQVRPVRPRIREQQRPVEPMSSIESDDAAPAIATWDVTAASRLDGWAKGFGETMFYLLDPESWR